MSLYCPSLFMGHKHAEVEHQFRLWSLERKQRLFSPPVLSIGCSKNPPPYSNIIWLGLLAARDIMGL